MLLVALLMVYIFFISYVYGYAFLKLFSQKNLFSLKIDPEIISILGLNILMTLLGILSLFFPINFKIHLIIVSIALLLGILFKKSLCKPYCNPLSSRKYIPLVVWIGCSLWVLLMLIQSIKIPFWSDVPGYHAQAIQWIEKYRAIPGLANLHRRYGFNPHSHLLSAFGNIRFLTGHPFYMSMTTYLMIIFGFLMIKRIALKTSNFKFVSAFLLFFILIFYRDWVSSPNPDIFTTIFSLILFIWTMENITDLRTDQATFYGFTFIVFSLITIKLSTVPIILLYLFVLITHPKHFLIKDLWKSALLGIFVFLPFFIRNYYLSGYLVFPVKIIDIFTVDWKLPINILNQEVDTIKYFARIPALSPDEVKKLSLIQWFPVWLSYRSFIEIFLFVLVLLYPFISILSFFSNNRQEVIKKYVPLGIIAFISCIYWFVLAPYFRFGHAYILITAIVTLVLIINYFGLDRWKNFIEFTCVFMVTSFIIYSIFRELQEFRRLPVKNVFLDIERMPIPSVKIVKFGEHIVYESLLPPYKYCWDKEIPCTSKIIKGLELRTNNIQDGFKIKP